jgi:C1A family cysteine protease
MKLLIVFITLTVVSVSAQLRNRRPTSVENLRIFNEWKEQYDKQYATQAKEDEAILKLLEEKRKIDAHNELYDRGEVSYRQKLFKYSDLNTEEKTEILTGLAVPPEEVFGISGRSAQPTFPPGPSSVNWTSLGLVAPVEDQGACNSCWAFSAVGVIDSVLRKQNVRIRTSPQQLVDCVTHYCWGCSSGWAKFALDYVKNNGIASESIYPYNGVNQNCSYNNRTGLTGIINEVYNIPTRGE